MSAVEALELTNPLDRLTPAQLEALALVAARVTIKEIAARQGVTPSAVNQRLAKCKARLDARNMRDLAAAFHRYTAASPGYFQAATTCTFSTATKKHLDSNEFPRSFVSSNETQVQPTLADSAAFIEAPWSKMVVPHIVPEALDGPSAAWVRIGVALCLTILILVAVISVITAGQTLTNLTRG
jgi:DNA-binding CsgD family transcriptional regulator